MKSKEKLISDITKLALETEKERKENRLVELWQEATEI